MSMICGMHAWPQGRPAGLDAMLAALPGGETAVAAAWTDAAAGLAWRGDPDLRSDRQERLPRVERDAGLAITASIRLDDRTALCGALGIPHGQGAELPDSALVLRAWERWGTECPGRLLGDFAFAVWDARRRTLFCVRDHIGTRPLFYSLSADRIVFASDVGAVLAAPGVDDALDEAVVAGVLGENARTLGASHTWYRAVRRLPPGHTLTVCGGSVCIERWWRPEHAPSVPIGGDDALAEALLELCGRAVEDRMRGVRRVGVHLSGGLDSSAIAALAAGAQRRAGYPSPPAFCWQAPPAGTNDAKKWPELRLIDAVRRAAGLEVFYCPADAAGVLAWLRRDGTRDPEIHPNEEPVQRRAAGQEVRVLLSGWGGDEGISFNGRGYEAGLLREGRLVALWRSMRARRRPFRAFVTRVALPLFWPDGLENLRELREGRRPWRNHAFIHPGFARRVRPLQVPDRLRAGVRPMQLYLLQLGHLAERMDGWAVSGARHGIEYGYPLLDRRVLEFALGLSPEQYRRSAVNRWLMRHALGALLPAEVCRQTDKTEPWRADCLLNAVAAALPAVRRILEAGPAPPARRGYLDMPRLMAMLSAERYLSNPRPWLLVNTVRFLDF